jgi:2-polyprenyl-6-methoxyphenol hydroxylase-like FAD-dependent oxidoreductase
MGVPRESAMDTQVLVVGAGPVGLTLAIDLGRRGIRCTLIDQKEAPQFLPKMERCNARTMEMHRRLGLAEKIRAAGLRGDVPMDVFVILAMTAPPLLHLPYPSVDEARRQIAACSDGSMPLEPYQLISQYTLEPLLKSVAETLPSVAVRYSCEFLSLQQSAESVSLPRERPPAQQRHCVRPTLSVATAAPAPYANNSAFTCAAKATCSNCGRRFIVAMDYSIAFQSATVRAVAAITMSPTIEPRS